jgi:hypothetical protein
MRTDRGVALGCVGTGVVMVLVGAGGAARHDLVADQLPYLASGGIGGAAVLCVGVAQLVIMRMRRSLAAEIRALEALVQRLANR